MRHELVPIATENKNCRGLLQGMNFAAGPKFLEKQIVLSFVESKTCWVLGNQPGSLSETLLLNGTTSKNGEVFLFSFRAVLRTPKQSTV